MTLGKKYKGQTASGLNYEFICDYEADEEGFPLLEGNDTYSMKFTIDYIEESLLELTEELILQGIDYKRKARRELERTKFAIGTNSDVGRYKDLAETHLLWAYKIQNMLKKDVVREINVDSEKPD